MKSADSSPQILRLDQLRGIRLDPLNSDVLQIEFRSPGPALAAVEPRWHWAPLNQIASIPLGSADVSEDLHIITPMVQKHRVRGFSTDNVRPLFFSRTTRFESANGSIGMHQATMTNLCYIHDDPVKPVAVPTAELTRFYLAAMSIAIDHLMHFDLEPLAIFDRYCDLTRTGFLDPERKTFRIAPVPGVCDRGSALQIAMMMTDERLLGSFARLARSIRIGVHQAGGELPHFRSADPLDLRLALADQNDGRIARVKGYALADRVLSDFRQPAFKHLIIELPFEFSRADFVAASDANDRQPRALVDPAPRYTPDRRPSSSTVRLAAAQGSFTQTFPYFASVRTAYETRRRLKSLLPVPMIPRPPPAAAMSPMPRSGNEPVARMNVALEGPAKPPPERVTADDLRFADAVPASLLPKLVAVEAKALDDRLARFFAAGTVLARYDEIDVGISSLVCAEPGCVRAFELQRACGGWAWSRRYGRGRYVLFLPLIVRERIVWAISIERKPRERISMGLIMSRDPAEPPGFLSRTLAALALRNSGGSGEHGTFPDHDYGDVRFDPVIHAPSRRQVSTLAATLSDRARALGGKEIGYEVDVTEAV